jgi:uncharacterized membrane protein
MSMTTKAKSPVTFEAGLAAGFAPRRIAFDAPWQWLAAGWRDMWTAPQLSLAYGGLFAIGAAILAIGLLKLEAASAFLALAGGFMILGPYLAIGLYEISRRISEGKSVDLADMKRGLLGSLGQLAFFGVVLMFIFLVWVQLAFLLLMLFMGGAGLPPPSQFMPTLLFTSNGLGLLIVGTIAGGVLATFVFSISALAVPMLMVKPVDAVTAARASLAAVIANPKPMTLWAALIVVMMAAGFATVLVGLIVAFPLIGHATWHAYAEIYGDNDRRP